MSQEEKKNPKLVAQQSNSVAEKSELMQRLMTFTHECGLIVYKSSTASCKLKQIGEIIMHMVNRKQSQNLKVLVFEK